MITYKFNLRHFAGNVQDSISYHEYKNRQEWDKHFSAHWDFDEVLRIGKSMYPELTEDNINSFCDGSDNVSAYFSPWDAETEAQGQADAYEIEVDGPGEYDCY